MEIARETRSLPSVELGASPRAAVHLLVAAKGAGVARGPRLRHARRRRRHAPAVLRHRLDAPPRGRARAVPTDDAVLAALQAVPVPTVSPTCARSRPAPRASPPSCCCGSAARRARGPAAPSADALVVPRRPEGRARGPAILSRGVPAPCARRRRGERSASASRAPPGPAAGASEADGGLERGRGRPGARPPPLPRGDARDRPARARLLVPPRRDEGRVRRLSRPADGAAARAGGARALPVDGGARGPLGLGTEFESVRDYLPDDDLRQVNWRATERLGRPMSNQYRIERDRDVICWSTAGG